MSNLLTFEWDEKNEILEIHGNILGLKLLKQKLDYLLSNSDDHTHLMVPSWGGKELSEISQSKDNLLIPHVKIYKWDKQD